MHSDTCVFSQTGLITLAELVTAVLISSYMGVL